MLIATVYDEDGALLAAAQDETEAGLAKALWNELKTEEGPLSSLPTDLCALGDALAYAGGYVEME